MSGSVSVRTVTQTAITIADHVGADDSESKSTDGAEKWNSEGKLRTFLRVFEKLNMVFIVLFICYLSWTIPAHYGLYTSESNSQKFTGNQTLLLQVKAEMHVRIQRGTGGPDTPLKNHKNIGSLSNFGPDPLKNHKTYQVSIQCLATIGPSAKRHLNGDLLTGR